MDRQDYMKQFANAGAFAANELNDDFNAMTRMTGYEKKTDIYEELSLAEWNGGIAEVRSVFDKHIDKVDNAEFFTEFVLCLNWKCWRWHEIGDREMVALYDELYHYADNEACEKMDGDALSYYLQTTD